MTDEQISKLQETALVKHAELDGALEEVRRLERIRAAVVALISKAKKEYETRADAYLRKTRDSSDRDPLDLFGEAAKVREAKALWQKLDDIDTPWYERLQDVSRSCTNLRQEVAKALNGLIALD